MQYRHKILSQRFTPIFLKSQFSTFCMYAIWVEAKEDMSIVTDNWGAWRGLGWVALLLVVVEIQKSITECKETLVISKDVAVFYIQLVISNNLWCIKHSIMAVLKNGLDPLAVTLQQLLMQK